MEAFGCRFALENAVARTYKVKRITISEQLPGGIWLTVEHMPIIHFLRKIETYKQSDEHSACACESIIKRLHENKESYPSVNLAEIFIVIQRMKCNLSNKTPWFTDIGNSLSKDALMVGEEIEHLVDFAAICNAYNANRAMNA